MVEGVVHSGEQNVISTVNWFGLYMEDFLMTMKVLRRFFQTASTRSNNMNNIIVQLYMGSSTSGLSSGKLAFPDRGTLFEFFLLLCFPYTPLEVLGSKEKENNLEW